MSAEAGPRCRNRADSRRGPLAELSSSHSAQLEIGLGQISAAHPLGGTVRSFDHQGVLNPFQAFNL